MKSEFLKLGITAIYVPIYQRYLSEEDMTEFWRSADRLQGRSCWRAPMLIRDAQVALKSKGHDMGIAIYARHKDEIDAAKKKYDAEHGTEK